MQNYILTTCIVTSITADCLGAIGNMTMNYMIMSSLLMLAVVPLSRARRYIRQGSCLNTAYLIATMCLVYQAVLNWRIPGLLQLLPQTHQDKPLGTCQVQAWLRVHCRHYLSQAAHCVELSLQLVESDLGRQLCPALLCGCAVHWWVLLTPLQEGFWH